MIADLRSDTVTRPSAGMRRAMAEADVGDDVYGEDPTVRRLEERIAQLLGKDAALFVPSGTMANQIAVRAHTEPGDEVILESRGHSFAYESGGLAALAGVQAKAIAGERGILSAEAIEAAVNPAPDHFARTRLAIVENTSNGGGGTIYPLETVRAIAHVAELKGIALHMDGARLWNASVASGVALADFTAPCDSASVCLSKGLGAPVGSLVAGTRAFIQRAHRFRKMYGGGMRQAGVLAAAGLYALEHNVARLAEDHAHLRALVEGLRGVPGLGLDADPDRHPTNIAYARTTRPAADVVARLAKHGVLAGASGAHEIRFVTHLDVDRAAIDLAIERIRSALLEDDLDRP